MTDLDDALRRYRENRFTDRDVTSCTGLSVRAWRELIKLKAVRTEEENYGRGPGRVRTCDAHTLKRAALKDGRTFRTPLFCMDALQKSVFSNIAPSTQRPLSLTDSKSLPTRNAYRDYENRVVNQWRDGPAPAGSYPEDRPSRARGRPRRETQCPGMTYLPSPRGIA